MTTTAAQCMRSGCGGTIDGGYCTLCGRLPPLSVRIAR